MISGGLGVSGNAAFALASKTKSTGNPLPMWRGFNLLDFFSPNPHNSYGKTTEDDFKWMSDWGFNFVRIPMAYPSYLKFDRDKNISPEEVYHLDEEALERVDQLVYLALGDVGQSV